jgi:hypothetical protein
MARKTSPVEWIKAEANAMLEKSVDEYKDQRAGIAHLLEAILHSTDNYQGFRYTRLPDDWDYDAPYDQAEWDKVDQTRRYYY